MPSLNKVLLMGNLTRDPELRYTASGAAVCEFGLAVNRKWTGKDGKSGEEVLFVDVTVWGKSGQAASEHLNKGSPVFIEGRLKLDTWESPQGKRSKISVEGESCQFLPNKAVPDSTGPVQDGALDVADDEIPF